MNGRRKGLEADRLRREANGDRVLVREDDARCVKQALTDHPLEEDHIPIRVAGVIESRIGLPHRFAWRHWSGESLVVLNSMK